jgi:hypothetical protein
MLLTDDAEKKKKIVLCTCDTKKKKCREKDAEKKMNIQNLIHIIDIILIGIFSIKSCTIDWNRCF